MKFITSFLLFIVVIVAGCNNDHGYKFWDISKFHLVDTALKNNDEIKLLYSSQGPGNNEDLSYYIQVVAVAQKNGDTVNILTTVNNGFLPSDKDKIFNYFDQNNIVTQNTYLRPEDVGKLNGPNKKDTTHKILKVARDPKYDGIANNNYPTVIGTIGIFTKNQ